MEIKDIKTTLDLVSWMLGQPGVYRCSVRVARGENGPHVTLFTLKWHDDGDTLEQSVGYALPDVEAAMSERNQLIPVEQAVSRKLAKLAAAKMGILIP